MAAASAFGAPGDFDPQFGIDGKAAVAFDLTGGDRDDQALASFPLPDGKLLVVGRVNPAGPGGTARLGIARLLANGTLDLSYDTDGRVTVETSMNRIVAAGRDGSGRILVGGTFTDPSNGDLEFAVQRFSETGTPDLGYGFFGIALAAFDRGGNNEDLLRDIVVAPSGEVHAVGRIKIGGAADYDFGIAKFAANGALQPAFNGNGLRTIAFDLDGAARLDDARAVSNFDPERLLIAGEALRGNGQTVVAVAAIRPDSGAIVQSFCPADSCQGTIQQSLIAGPGRRTFAFDPLGSGAFDLVFAVSARVEAGGGPFAIVGRSFLANANRPALAVLNGNGTFQPRTPLSSPHGQPLPAGRRLLDLGGPGLVRAVAHDVARNLWIFAGDTGTAPVELGFAGLVDLEADIVPGFATGPDGPLDIQLIEFPRGAGEPAFNQIVNATVDSSRRYLLTGSRLFRRAVGIEDNDFAIARLTETQDGIFANGFE